MPTAGSWLPLLGFLAGVAMWCIDAAVDVMIHPDEITYADALFSDEPTERWMRTLVLVVLTAGGVFARALFGRLARIAARLADNEARLEQLVEARTQELEEKNRILERLATTDSMTGLPNRRHFQDLLSRQLAHYERTHCPFALLMLDVDGFKSVNDSFGHDAGDKVIEELGALLGSTVRTADTAARWGGEEFAVLALDTDREGAVILAERIREDCAGHTFSIERPITLSVGVAVVEEGSDRVALFREADRCLYAAKAAGRNRVVASEPGAPS